MKVLVTGCDGLIGSEAVSFYDARDDEVLGIDCNARAEFFGEGGDTRWNRRRLLETTRARLLDMDVVSSEIPNLMESWRPDLIVHCAAQPSHDRAASMPIRDFQINAFGTVNLLQAMREHAPDSVFIHISTSKVYGDTPNRMVTWEMPTRYEQEWIDEDCSIDHSLHSLFGVSKLAGDVYAQEYARYFGLKIGIFRPGCLTGPWHSPVEQHGFLAYLVKCAMTGTTYRVFGYKGKQVRDNLHCYDVVTAFEEYRKNPRSGEVYNLGGGIENAISILEAFDLVKSVTGREVKWEYVDKVRLGDHRCYVSDLTKFQSHYPDWRICHSLRSIIEQIAAQFSPLSSR